MALHAEERIYQVLDKHEATTSEKYGDDWLMDAEEAIEALHSARQELANVRAELEEVRRHARSIEDGVITALEEIRIARLYGTHSYAYKYLTGFLRPTIRWLHDLGGGGGELLS